MSNQLPVAVPTKLTPGELPLTLAADVLRVPYTPATRFVLAEVVSLYAATGNCYCSDAHLAARLTISKDTASVAVQLLVADGLLLRQVDKAAGNIRHLVPVPKAIALKASTNPFNPYPENPGRATRKNPEAYPENPGRATRKNPEAYPENPRRATRKNPEVLPGNSGSNTTVKSTEILQESHTLPAPEKKTGAGEFLEDSTPSLKAEVQLVPPVAEPPHAAESRPVAAAELEPALAAEAKALANEIAPIWDLSEIRHQPKWARIHGFTRCMARLGRLPEVKQQLAGYRDGHLRPGVRPHQLDKWLGSAADDYAGGEWCGCDWPGVAAKVLARPPGQPAPPPARAGGSPSQAAAYRPR
jgi:hypothetical protein